MVAPEDAETTRDEGWWPRLGLLHYAVLRTTNAARRRGRLSPEDAARALRQAAVEGARGHSLAAAWATRLRASRAAAAAEPDPRAAPAAPGSAAPADPANAAAAEEAVVAATLLQALGC